MSRTFIEGKVFQGNDFSVDALPKGDYEDCRFVNCSFSAADLSEINFVACAFEGCDLSLAKTKNTAFREVTFRDCKLLGLHFDDCHDILFSVDFSGCQLNLSSFYQRIMRNTNFKSCSLQEVDFTESDLTGSVFENCDFGGAIFENNLLEKTDFRTSYNFSIDPEMNRIKKAKFSMAGIVGLLDKYDIEVE